MELTKQIIKFNAMYGVDSNDLPTRLPKERLMAFKEILAEELEEIDEIIDNYDTPGADLFVNLSDLLGDLQVYCASEMRRWGLPNDEVLGIIMESNFSKLGDDGKPIIDERGKILKGPNYWKPEPQIAAMLDQKVRRAVSRD